MASATRPIVAGVDRSERTLDGLALARTLARATGASLVLGAVYPHDPGPHGRAGGAYARALEEEAQETLVWAASLLAGVAHVERRAVASLSVAGGLQALAEAEGAAAIVVGPSHRGPLGRIAPGSVGERLLHGAPCAVAAAPRGYRGTPDPRPRRIGIAYVPVPDAEAALRAGFSLGRAFGARVRVVSVAEPATTAASLPLGWGYGELESERRAMLEHALRDAVADAPVDLEVSAEVVDGYADVELIRLSGEVDLLVSGSRGYGPLGTVVLGSASGGLVRKASCPVVVVPRGLADPFGHVSRPAVVVATAGSGPC